MSITPEHGFGTAGMVLVINKDDHSLSLVDAQSMQLIDTVQLSGVTGHEVAAHPVLPLAYAPIYSDAPVGKPGTNGSTIDVIDLMTGERQTIIDLHTPSRPHCALFGADGLLYVTTEVTKSITVIDPETHELVRQLNTGHDQAHMMAFSADARHVYTANVAPGSISVMRLDTGELLDQIAVSEVINRISVSVDGRYAFTGDQRQSRLAVVDLMSNMVVHWVDLPASPFGTAVTPDGSELIMALRATNQVAKLDLVSFTITGIVDVPPTPQMILLDPSGTIAYTASNRVGVLSAIRIKDMSLIGSVATGQNADGIAFSPVVRK